jgi:SpoVK/Ycf46/Vps4 family AAA+-type ATPase
MLYKLRYFFVIITFSKTNSFQDVLEPINIKSRKKNKYIIEEHNYPIMNQNLEVVVNETAEDNVNKEDINDNDKFVSKISEDNNISYNNTSNDIVKTVFLKKLIITILCVFVFIVFYNIRNGFIINFFKNLIKSNKNTYNGDYKKREKIFKDTFLYEEEGEVANMIKDLNVYYKNYNTLVKEGKKISKIKYIALYGPPGTGKTTLPQAFAKLHNATFITTNGGDFFNKFYGGTTEKTENFLQQVRDTKGPVVGFIDEVEVIAGSRSEDTIKNNESLTKLLTYDFTVSSYPKVIFYATNRIQDVDAALIRAERTAYLAELNPPKKEVMENLFKQKILTSMKEFDLSFDTTKDEKYYIEKMKKEMIKTNDSESITFSDIQDFVGYLQREVMNTSNNKITKDVMESAIKTLNSTIKRRKEIADKIANKKRVQVS